MIDTIIKTEATRKNVRAMIPILVHWAKTGQTNHTYGDLIHAIGKTTFSGIGHALYAVQSVIDKLSSQTQRTIPTLNSLVKNSKTHIPSEGFEFVSETYNELDHDGKVVFVKGLDSEAINYSHWDWVLNRLGLSSYVPFTDEDLHEIKTPKTKYGTGEGKEHKELKEFIRNHPDVIGIKGVLKAEIEYSIPSGDKLDVYFELTDGTNIAVEVKPSTSDDSDITRGIFQCVKYKAVLEAMQSIDSHDYDINVIYLTARPLNDMHNRLIDILSVNHKAITL